MEGIRSYCSDSCESESEFSSGSLHGEDGDSLPDFPITGAGDFLAKGSLQKNFGEVMQGIQDELKCSEFFACFKRNLCQVLDEWDIRYIETRQDIYLSRGSQTVKKAKTSDIDIVCYGLGEFSHYFESRFQLGFLLLLEKMLHPVHVYVYDPVFYDAEINYMKEAGLDILNIDENAKRTMSRKTVCFIPHCHFQLANNVLWANWNVERLSELAIIGNSFKKFKGRKTLSRKYILLAKKFVTEIRMTNNFRYDDVFYGSSVHYFKSSSLSLVDPLVWSKSKEPF